MKTLLLAALALAVTGADLDRAYQAKADEVEREFQERVAFLGRMKEERLDFERRLVSDHKRFLEELPATPPHDRRAAWERFHDGETFKRREFDRHEEEQRQAFRRQYLEEKRDAATKSRRTSSARRRAR